MPGANSELKAERVSVEEFSLGVWLGMGVWLGTDGKMAGDRVMLTSYPCLKLANSHSQLLES